MIKIIRSQADFEVDYKNQETRNLIKQDFFKMCYLCEEVTRHFEIDHFYPQKHYPEHINDWDNLFYICQKCNKIRFKEINTHSGNEVLNNCTDDVEKLVVLRFNQKENRVEITTDVEEEDKIWQKTNNTIKLLNKIYNESKSSLDLKDEISKEIINF